MDDFSVYLGSTNLLGITNNMLSSSHSTLLDESEEKRTAENSAAPDGIFTVTYFDEMYRMFAFYLYTTECINYW